MTQDNENEIAYQESLDYLYSFIDYSLTRSLRYSPEKFNLDRMVALLDLLGNPHREYPVIHVAGTKGKGSVSAMCASVLRRAGYHVGVYTSPHLQDYAERIQVDGISISHRDMAVLVNRLKPFVEKVAQLTTFELTTALGFMYFEQQKIDIAVIEVGLGGRLDATNVVTPLVSVITSLSYDHMNVLGSTLGEIAREKAGIIKPGRPVVVAPQKDEAMQVVEQIAAERGSPLIETPQVYGFTSRSHSLDGQKFALWRRSTPLGDESTHLSNHPVDDPAEFTLPLLGLHQVENAVTAYAALQVVRQAGFEISEDAIREGLAHVSWPARFELLRREPAVIVDSAHNRDSAQKLAQTLVDYLPGKPVILVFGASEDKDVDGMFTELLPRVRKVIATQSIHPRAADAASLVELAKQHQVPAEAIMPIEAALAAALEEAGRDAVVLITGSIFVAAAAREIWNNMVHGIGEVDEG